MGTTGDSVGPGLPILHKVPSREMDSNAVFAILLLLAGIGILTAEVFVPSGGLLGMITFFTLIVSVVFAYRAWGTSHPNIFWLFCCVLLILVPSALVGAFYMFPRTALGKRVLLEGPEADEMTPFMKQGTHLQELVGQFGMTASPLTPGGLVKVHGERLHAFTEGLIVEVGRSIEVLEVRGNRLLVRPGEPPTESGNGTEPSSRLDFEIPQG